HDRGEDRCHGYRSTRRRDPVVARARGAEGERRVLGRPRAASAFRSGPDAARRGQSRRPRGRPRARRAAHGRDPQAGQHPAGARDHRVPGGRRDRAASRPRTGPGWRAARAPGLAGAFVGLAFEDGPDALKQAERSLRHVVALRSFGRACRLRAATLPTGATALAARSPIAAGTSAVAVASLPPAPVTVRFASRVAFRPARGGLVAGRTCGAPAATAPASPAAPGLRRFLVLVPTVIPDGLAG